MAIIKRLLTAVILLLISQGVLLQDNEIVNSQIVEDFKENLFCLQHNVWPVHYKIKLVIPHIVEDDFTTDGETDINVEVREPTNTIELHAVKLTIDESLTKITRKDADINSKSEYVPKQHEYNLLTQILTLQFEELLDPGFYMLHFTFTGEIRQIFSKVLPGLYTKFHYNDEGSKAWLAVTHFQATRAREVFPCWDEPHIKSSFQLSIKHHSNYTALSNMPSGYMRSEIDQVDGKKWTHFYTTPPMPAYLLGFVIAEDYDYVSNSNGNVKIWGPKHLLSHALYYLDIAEKAMQELEKFTNITVPVPKMDHVAIPTSNGVDTDCENWGLNVYKQDILLEDKNLLHAVSNVDNIMAITNKLAHQWFGNLVSPSRWKYFWLTEGISIYLKFHITDKLVKEKRFMDFIVIDDGQRILYTDALYSTPIHANLVGHDLDVTNASFTRIYMKSAFLLRMASHFLTEDVFQNGLIKYLRINDYRSVTPDDLWKALQDALDESNVIHDDFTVKDVMDTWFEQAGHPVVMVNRNYATGEIKLTQEIFKSPKNNLKYSENKNGKWWIPINFVTQSNLDFSSTLATHWLKPRDKDITINGVNTDDWIIVNKQMTGFYRVNYDTINWKRIAAFLNSDNYEKIPVINRAQILDDAYYMMVTERLDSTTFIEIMNYLAHETDPAPWISVMGNFFMKNNYLRLPEGEAILKPYLSKLMRKQFERINIVDNPDEDLFTADMRMYLYLFVCVHGLKDCQAKITSTLLAYVKDPIANKPSFPQERIFCHGLIKANESFWDQFLQAHQKTSNSHKQFLGCSENLHILEKHLNSFSNDTKRYSVLLENMFRFIPNTDPVIDFVINHYEGFKDDPDIVGKLIDNSFREKELNKIKAFAEQHNQNYEQRLNERRTILKEMSNNLSKFQGALENIKSTNPAI